MAVKTLERYTASTWVVQSSRTGYCPVFLWIFADGTHRIRAITIAEKSRSDDYTIRWRNGTQRSVQDGYSLAVNYVMDAFALCRGRRAPCLRGHVIAICARRDASDAYMVPCSRDQIVK